MIMEPRGPPITIFWPISACVAQLGGALAMQNKVDVEVSMLHHKNAVCNRAFPDVACR